MTGEAMAAVIGVSAGVGSVVGGWVALWWRDRVPAGHEQLLQYLYPFLDDLLGATTTENSRRSWRRFHVEHPRIKWMRPRTYRRVFWFVLPLVVRQRIANYFWPEVKIARGGNPLPEVERIGIYIQIKFRGSHTFTKPYQVWNIQGVRVWPTSEANFLGENYDRNLARKVAQAMRLTGVDQLDIDSHPELGYIDYARKAPPKEMATHVPHEVTVDA